MLCNPTSFTCKIAKGTCLDMALEVNLIVPTPSCAEPLTSAKAGNVTSADTSDCQWKLTQSIAEIGAELPWKDKSSLYSLLCKYHDAFVLENGKRGETDWTSIPEPSPSLNQCDAPPLLLNRK